MYCSNCGTELPGSKHNFCSNCGAKIGDAVSLGMVDFDVIDDTIESIEKGMIRFETNESYSANNIPKIKQQLSNLYTTIKELLTSWVECYRNFTTIEIDFYLAVKYKYKEGTKLLLVDKQEHWDEWYNIMSELKACFDEAQYLLSILKPKLFDNSEKKTAYRNAINTFEEYALKYNALREMVAGNDEIKIIENDN
jgi:hypothetical protein